MKVKRIHIFGTSGSGKTFLSKKLSEILKTESYDLDDIFWERKYDLKRDETKRKSILKKITHKNRWIVEGCFSSWIDDSIKRSDLVIWLDLHYSILAYRIILRFFRRKFGKGIKHKESLKDLVELIKYAKSYHNKDMACGYSKHKLLIEKHKAEFVYIRSKKELNKFLNEFVENNKN